MFIPIHPKEPVDQSKLVNTRIEYLYRDAANWKQHNECVVAGRVTEEQKKAILDSLLDGTDFVPHKVGMPETRFARTNDDDVETFELYPDNFTYTAAEPDIDPDITELTALFESMAGKWIDEAEER